MPRLLPRLARIVQAQPGNEKIFPFDIRRHRPRRPNSLHKTTLPSPSFVPDAYPQSILLQPENPIATPDHYFRHKTLPPRVYIPKNARKRDGEHDWPRQMTEEERKWWSSPYLRMLATPPRKCALSGRLLPSGRNSHFQTANPLLTTEEALLLRLAPVRMSDTEYPSAEGPVPSILVPDGLQHPQYTARRSNRSVHVLCSRQATSFILENNKIGRIPSYVSIPSNLGAHVSHLLRLRVLQELELFVAQLKAKPKADILANPPIRQLSMSEWRDIEENRRIPWQDAVAVINVPPIPKEAEPSTSPFPLPPDPDMEANALQSVAAMYPVSRDSPFPSNFQYRDVLPSAKVPLYDAIGLFPHVAQRAALFQFLNQAQSIYTVAQQQNNSIVSLGNSHAYLLSSNSEIVKLGDMAAVATALWRVYLFEKDIVRE